MRNEDVVEHFAKARYPDSMGTAHLRVVANKDTGVTTLYSYNEPIARRFGALAGWRESKAWVTSNKFSKTTTQHTNKAVFELGMSGWLVARSPECPDTHDAMLVSEDTVLEHKS
jgi:hypothetical protein